MGMFAQVVVVLVPALLLTGYSVFLLWRGDRRPLVWALLFNGLLLFFVTHYAWRELIASARISLGLVVATLALAALRRDRQGLMLFGSWWLITNSLYVLITQDKVL
jgi:hypothetical protein